MIKQKYKYSGFIANKMSMAKKSPKLPPPRPRGPFMLNESLWDATSR